MADEDSTTPHNDTPNDEDAPQPPTAFEIEIVDSLPADRAVVAVIDDQGGTFTWLASRRYLHPRRVDQLAEQLQQIVHDHWA